MTLKEYLNTHKEVDRTRFASELGLSYPYLLCLYREDRVPSVTTALQVQKMTDGKVTVYDWKVKEKKK